MAVASALRAASKKGAKEAPGAEVLKREKRMRSEGGRIVVVHWRREIVAAMGSGSAWVWVVRERRRVRMGMMEVKMAIVVGVPDCE